MDYPARRVARLPGAPGRRVTRRAGLRVGRYVISKPVACLKVISIIRLQVGRLLSERV